MTRSSVVYLNLLSTIFYEGETQEVIKRYYVTQCGRLRATEVIVLAWDTKYSITLLTNVPLEKILPSCVMMMVTIKMMITIAMG